VNLLKVVDRPREAPLNGGIRTEELDYVRWVIDPDAVDDDIVDAMRLPPRVSIEALADDEARALDTYHTAWSAVSGMDTRELFSRNSACKRVLYLSAPILLPDTIAVDNFVGAGVNQRIHVYEAADVHDTIRLEAVSSYAVGPFRFRYALSIQYAADSTGLGWQVIRPVIVIDSAVLAAVREGGEGTAAKLERVLDALWRLVLFGSHDYVHATVLNWFAPLSNLPPEYAAITSERVHPPELGSWHACSQLALPDGLVGSRVTPGIATLELYSLMVHAQVIARIWDEDPRLREHVTGLLSEFVRALAELGADEVFGASEAVIDYFMTLAGWFLVSALPLGSERLADVLPVLPAEQWTRASERLAATHDGMFDFVRLVDVGRFPWGDRLVPVHEVAAEYEKALRLPALRENVGFLLRPRRDRPDGSTWLDVVCASLQEADRVMVREALDGPPAESRALEVLRALAEDAGPGHPPAVNYAWTTFVSTVQIIDRILGRPHT
jgi:hypothetical protein